MINEEMKTYETQKMKRAATVSGPLTVEQMMEDPLYRLALEEWGGVRKPLSLPVVEKLFAEVLQGTDVHRIALLEASKYLEE